MQQIHPEKTDCGEKMKSTLSHEVLVTMFLNKKREIWIFWVRRVVVVSRPHIHISGQWDSLSCFCHFREPTDVEQRVAACLRLNKIVFIIICTIPVKRFELLVCLLPNAVI